jgi:predicted DNA-binding transcriptional regulator AlpA
MTNSERVQPPHVTEGDLLLTPEEAARLIGMSVSWLAKARARGDGPRCVRYGRSVRWRWRLRRSRSAPRSFWRLWPGGVERYLEINPMHQSIETRLGNLRRALRCGAKTRAGAPCQSPAVHGRSRCRMHGGLNPGAPRGARNGNFKDGTWTTEAIEERRWLRSLVQSFAKPVTTP